MSLPSLTKGRHHTKCTMSQGGSDAYQMLPDPMLAARNPLVFLDWSTNAYHSAYLGLNPAADRLYQAPPPGNNNGYYTLLYVLTMVGYEAVPIYFTFGIGLIVFGLCE